VPQEGVTRLHRPGVVTRIHSCGYLAKPLRPAIIIERRSMALLRWLTRRCFVCGRLWFMHSVKEEARCENMPLPIQLLQPTDKAA
jgi:hypothetical protein